MKPDFTDYSGQPDRKGSGGARRQPARPVADPSMGPIINWRALWLRLSQVLRALWHSVRYSFGNRAARPVNPAMATTTATSGRARFLNNLPWLRLGLVAVVIFMLTQKDIRFSIHLKSPLAMFRGEDNPTAPTTDQFGVLQTMPAGQVTVERTPAFDFDQLDDATVEAYINRFAVVARTEMNKFNVPASVKLAQAIYESRAGQAMAAQRANNHFGGPMAGKDYDSAWANWRQHSLLLRRQWPHLLELGNDHDRWTEGLQAAGYNKDPRYAADLQKIIKRYRLHQYDDAAL